MADEPQVADAPDPVPSDEDVLTAEPALLDDAPLGGEVDEWGTQDGAVAFVRIAGFPSKDEANEVARHLVEGGIGATVADDPGRAATDPDGRYGVHVLPTERRRAAERLGLVELEERPEASPVEKIKVDRGPIPWKVVLPIFAIALVVVPLAAGFATYFFMSR